MINRDEQKSFFMIDPAIVEDNKKSYAIQESYKETYGLDALGINPSIVHRNLSPTVLIEKAIRNGEGILTDTGALAVTTGKFTGRSPHDHIQHNLRFQTLLLFLSVKDLYHSLYMPTICYSLPPYFIITEKQLLF